jgi:hypothetical protein
MNTEFGQNPTNWCLSFEMSVFVFLSAWLWKKWHPLYQGNYKNAFCQSIPPPEEVTIVCPSSGESDANPHKYWLLLQTLYGLWRSPRHWCNKFNAIL